jgi:hypothetical protein
MFVGGYFSDAMGTQASSIARLEQRGDEIKIKTMEINPSFSNTTYEADDDNGVSGVVMTIAPMSENKVVFGGIYQGKEEAATPYMMNVWDVESGTRCVLNSYMANLDQCKSKHPPTACCESALGTVYASLKIAEDEFVVGGEFFNTLGLEVGADVDPTDPINSKPTAALNIGYQNLAVLSLGTYGSSGDIINPPKDLSNSTRDLVGGPSGEVLSLQCGTWSAEEERCVEIIVGGAFKSWERFEVDADLAITRTKVFSCPQQVASLIWSSENGQYYPAETIVEAEAEAFGTTWNSASETTHSVNTVWKNTNTSTLYVGGNFPRMNNMFKYVWANETYSYSYEDEGNITGYQSLPTPGGPEDDGTGMNAISYSRSHGGDRSEFQRCTQWAADASDGELDFVGASFCCRQGSYCPQNLIDIQCPTGWGYYCWPSKAGACDPGYVRAKRAQRQRVLLRQKQARSASATTECPSAAEGAASRASAKEAHASAAETGSLSERNVLLRRKRAASRASARKRVLLRQKQARSASATTECPSAAKAGCFARGLSGGDPPPV